MPRSERVPIDRTLEDACYQTARRLLTARGWSASTDAPFVIAPVEGRFRLGNLDDELVVVGALSCEKKWDERGEPTWLYVSLGVTSPAAERALASLDLGHNAVVGEDLTAATTEQLVATADECHQAVEEAAEAFESGAVQIRELVGTLDAYVDQVVVEARKYQAYAEDTAVTVAAAGHPERARAILAAITDRSDLQIANKIGEWLDAGAPIPPVSDEAFPPPAPRPSHEDRTYFSVKEAGGWKALTRLALAGRTAARKAQKP